MTYFRHLAICLLVDRIVFSGLHTQWTWCNAVDRYHYSLPVNMFTGTGMSDDFSAVNTDENCSLKASAIWVVSVTSSPLWLTICCTVTLLLALLLMYAKRTFCLPWFLSQVYIRIVVETDGLLLKLGSWHSYMQGEPDSCIFGISCACALLLSELYKTATWAYGCCIWWF